MGLANVGGEYVAGPWENEEVDVRPTVSGGHMADRGDAILNA